MKTLVSVLLLVACVAGRGSGPYLPSGWRPTGPAFYLPSEVQKQSEAPLKVIALEETEPAGSDSLREYGPPKVQEVSQDISNQGLPDAVSGQTFVTIEKTIEPAIVVLGDSVVEGSTEDKVKSVVEEVPIAPEAIPVENKVENQEAGIVELKVETEVQTSLANQALQDSVPETTERNVEATISSIEAVVAEEVEQQGAVIETKVADAEKVHEVTENIELKKEAPQSLEIVPEVTPENVISNDLMSQQLNTLTQNIEEVQTVLTEQLKEVVSIEEQIVQEVKTIVSEEVKKAEEVVSEVTGVISNAVKAVEANEVISGEIKLAEGGNVVELKAEEPANVEGKVEEVKVEEIKPTEVYVKTEEQVKIVNVDEVKSEEVKVEEKVKEVKLDEVNVETLKVEEVKPEEVIDKEEVKAEEQVRVEEVKVEEVKGEKPNVEELKPELVKEEKVKDVEIKKEEVIAKEKVEAEEPVIVEEVKIEEVKGETVKVEEQVNVEEVLVEEVKLEEVKPKEEAKVAENVITVQEVKPIEVVRAEEAVKPIENVAVSEVKILDTGVNNIAQALANLESEIKAEQVQSIDLDKTFLEVAGSVAEVPEGFLEYGPPGFKEYGPPKGEDLLRTNSIDQESFENNEARRRRFSPKFRPPVRSVKAPRNH